MGDKGRKRRLVSATIPIRQLEPQTIAAGDDVSWDKSFHDYPATEWTLHYVLRNKAAIYTFAATATGQVFRVTLTSAETAQWKPGVYAVGAYVSATGKQVAVRPSFPTMTVTPNLASNPAGVATESFAVRMLATLESTIEALATRRVNSASVNGQAYTLANLSELYQLREKFASEVRREKAQERLNAGLGSSTKIGIRFRPLNAAGYPPQIRVPWQ